MVATYFRLSSIPSVGGFAAGAAFTLVSAFMPAAMPDALALDDGLSGVVLAVALGMGAGAVAWAALYLLFGTDGVFAREGGKDGMPQVRSADRHPDAPPRKPLCAADLSTRDPDGDEGPLPIVGPAAPIERPVPNDLDQPLAEFDPRAIRAEPRAPARAVPPMTKPPATAKPAPLAPGERIDCFEISSRHAAQAGAPSIEALLARLERGSMSRRREVGRAG